MPLTFGIAIASLCVIFRGPLFGGQEWHERQVVQALRDYAKAQESFAKSEGKYARGLQELRKHGAVSGSIAAAHIDSGGSYHGYVFMEGRLVGGRPIDQRHGYLLFAVPLHYGTTRWRTFRVDEGWGVLASNHDPGTLRLDDAASELPQLLNEWQSVAWEGWEVPF
ncbi:MAG TPA: hypothetical protein PK280_15590 [Planctomycetota bacterium]|nr:hypothetical protein [Planctomycetota bacterium]